MVVRIDDARRKHQARAIDHAVTGTRRDRPNLRNRVTNKPHVGAPQRGAGAIGDLRTADGPAGRSGLSREFQTGDQDQRQDN